MRYRLLGRSGLRVSEIGLGTMTFGQDWGWGADDREAGRIFDEFVSEGGNFVDTANVYTNGTSETLLAKLIAPQRERLVLATKYGCSTRRADVNSAGGHRKNLVQSLDASLRRLNTDYVDLFWIHIWDFTTPLDEVMRALDDQVRAGKILYVGASDTPAWIVSQANAIAPFCGWSPFIGIQAEYNLVERGVERELLPMAQSLGIGVIAWSPLAGGLLSGKYHGNGASKDGRLTKIPVDRLTERNMRIGETVLRVARELGRSPAQVALNWLRVRPFGVIPIVGARTVDQLRENLGCLDWSLDARFLEQLDAASNIYPGFPSAMIASSIDFVYGDTAEKIDLADNRVPIAMGWIGAKSR